MKNATKRASLVRVERDRIVSDDPTLNARLAVKFRGESKKLSKWISDFVLRG